jgi:uncharacterized SAM-binding protein YcdF (DUF218 family)
MTLLLALLLFIATSCLAMSRYRKTSLVVLVIAIGYFVIIGSGLLPSWLLKGITLPTTSFAPDWGKKNAIVLLGAGTVKLSHTVQPTMIAYSRLYSAARLYLSCKKSNSQCVIVISGGDASHTGTPEAVAYRNALLQLNINNADMQLESHSMNTYQNAEWTSPILKAGHFDRIFLVTSGIHIKRAILYFSHFGIKSIPIASDSIRPYYSIIPLGYHFAIADFALHEYIGIIRFYVYLFFQQSCR